MRRASQKQQTRENIIHAALELSAVKGFSCLSLREVAREAGISPNTFYVHFASMDDLGLALITDAGIMLREMMLETRRRVRKNESVVRISVATFHEFVNRYPNHFRLLLIERSGSIKPLRMAANKAYQTFVSDLQHDIVQASMVNGRKMSSPNLVAQAVVTITFSSGTQIIDLSGDKIKDLLDDTVAQIRLVSRGSEAKAADWRPPQSLKKSNTS